MTYYNKYKNSEQMSQQPMSCFNFLKEGNDK